jgi:hypothetical protein
MPEELRIFVPEALRAVFASLALRVEAEAGVPLHQIVDLNPAIPNRIASGEAYDIGLTSPNYAQALIDSGFADPASHRAFGRIPLAVGRRTGAEVAVITDSEGIKALFLDAGSIAYTDAGSGGRLFLEAIGLLGLVDTISDRCKAMPGGVPAASVAVGEVELAVAPLTTVLATPGVDVAAVFPDSLGIHIDMSVFLACAPLPAAAGLIDFLTSPDLDADLAAAGVDRFELA